MVTIIPPRIKCHLSRRIEPRSYADLRRLHPARRDRKNAARFQRFPPYRPGGPAGGRRSDRGPSVVRPSRLGDGCGLGCGRRRDGGAQLSGCARRTRLARPESAPSVKSQYVTPSARPCYGDPAQCLSNATQGNYKMRSLPPFLSPDWPPRLGPPCGHDLHTPRRSRRLSRVNA